MIDHRPATFQFSTTMVSLREREGERGKKDKKGKCDVIKHDSQNDKTTSAHTENNMQLRKTLWREKEEKNKDIRYKMKGKKRTTVLVVLKCHFYPLHVDSSVPVNDEPLLGRVRC